MGQEHRKKRWKRKITNYGNLQWYTVAETKNDDKTDNKTNSNNFTYRNKKNFVWLKVWGKKWITMGKEGERERREREERERDKQRQKWKEERKSWKNK